MTQKFSILFLLLVLHVFSITAQSNPFIPSYLSNPDVFITTNATILDNSGWLQFNEGFTSNPETFFTTHRLSFDLTSDDNMQLINTFVDNYPFTTPDNQTTHYKFQQIHKGIEVEHCQYILHFQNGELRFANGKMACNLNKTIIPSLTEAQCLNSALNMYPSASIFAWQDQAMEDELKLDGQDNSLTYYPKGKLVFAHLGGDFNYRVSDFTLCYTFPINCLSEHIMEIVFVDANTGQILKREPLTSNDGPATMQYYGIKTVDTRSRAWPYNDFVLETDGSSRNIITKETTVQAGNNPYGSFSLVKSTSDTWPLAKSDMTMAHWAVSNAWDYYKNTFNRNGCNGNGRIVRIWASIDGFQNAQFTKLLPIGIVGKTDNISFGFKNGFTFATRDIAGHEFTHGVLSHTTMLNGFDEAGALGESYCDIFGYMVERFQNGNVGLNWTHGEDMNNITRNMANPPSITSTLTGLPCPTIYKGVGWFNGAADNGGIHTNCNVQNYWFYLLSKGSVGTIPGTYNNIPVNGIGEDNASKITFMTMTSLITDAATYTDARNGSLVAAHLLFGYCSNEYVQTVNAWAAVDLGKPIMPIQISGPQHIYYNNTGTILGGMPKVYTASGQFNTYNWFCGGAWNTSVSGQTNNVFTINDFNGLYTPTILQLNATCQSTAIKIYFHDLSGWNLTDPGTISSEGAIKVFPNPASGRKLYFIPPVIPNSNPTDKHIITIVDMEGVYQFQQEYTDAELPEYIDIDSLMDGDYIFIYHKGNVILPIRFSKI